MSGPPQNAAIRFEPEGYELPREGLLGRHSAGNGFLRAAVHARNDAPVVGYGPRAKGEGEFAALVQAIEPAAETRWLRSHQFGQLNAAGVCYRPDPAIGAEARLRLRVGPARYCLCGVTHTLSTGRMADAIAEFLTAPLMPWDALICTSQAALGVVRAILEEQAEYLKWRLGQGAAAIWPQLPVIPPELLERVLTAPKAAASRQDPFAMFGHYPTFQISVATRLRPTEGDPVARFRQSAALFPELIVSEAEVANLAARLASGDLTVAEAAAAMGWPADLASRKAAVLAKLDLVRLDD